MHISDVPSPEKRPMSQVRLPRFAIARGRIGRVSISERLLLALSKHPDDVSGYEGVGALNVMMSDADPLGQSNDFSVRGVFPGFDEEIRGRDVMDFGCGHGAQSLAILRAGATRVVGIDINPSCVALARRLTAGINGISFALTAAAEGQFDAVISICGFEHFADPPAILRELLTHTKVGGKIFITFGPPWNSPYGAHMHFFTRLPWVHFLFRERTVLRVHRVYRKPIDHRAPAYKNTMNGMSVAAFLRYIDSEPVRTEHLRLDCIKGLNFLARIPLLREFFVTNIACILTRFAWRFDSASTATEMRPIERSESGSGKSRQAVDQGWWVQQDSNLRPAD